MRKSFSNVAIQNDSNNVFISFGFDFCSEHEHGIKNIQSALNCEDLSKNGVERYLVNNATPENTHIFDIKFTKDKKSYHKIAFISGSFWDYQNIVNYVTRNVKNSYSYDKPHSEWDESSCAFVVDAGGKDEKNLRLIYEAMMNKDAVLFIGGGNPFGGAGIVIARYSTIPAEIKKKIKETHLDKIKLKKASDATGIVKKIDLININYKSQSFFNKPLGYYALSPGWKLKSTKDYDAVKTKYPVMYWLNPMNQDKINYGWFTVEDLEKWIAWQTSEDKKGLDPGPIPKIKK